LQFGGGNARQVTAGAGRTRTWSRIHDVRDHLRYIGAPCKYDCNDDCDD
jgi:hypothetical protein